MRLLLDQGLSPYSVEPLRELGHDVIHVQHVGMFQSSDFEILQFASVEERIIVTLDADYHMLLAHHRFHKQSVIRIREEAVDAEPLVEILKQLCTLHQAELDAGCMLTMTYASTRIHLLPIC